MLDTKNGLEARKKIVLFSEINIQQMREEQARPWTFFIHVFKYYCIFKILLIFINIFSQLSH